MTTRIDRAGTGRRVRGFYEQCSFPGYEPTDTPRELIERSRQRAYAHLLGEHLPLGIRVLDAGCGTGQLAIFLSLAHRTVIGADFSAGSLAQGNAFRQRFGLTDVSFVQMDLFAPAFAPGTFDYILTNGVLHHTADAAGAFANLCTLLKPGGGIAVGLYNSYGRLLLHLRRRIFQLTGERFHRLDYFMRRDMLGADKKRVWFRDQYENPHEDTFSVDDVLGWFRTNGIQYVASVPGVRFGDDLRGAERLFEPRDPGSRWERIACQLLWIITQSREGGFFLTFGRKP